MTYIPGPAQLAAHHSESRIKQVVGGWRAGKAGIISCDIDTVNRGMVKLVDLEVGDFVWDMDGVPTRVTGKSPIWRGRDCFRVLFRDGAYLDVDAEHEWEVWREDGSHERLDTKELRETDLRQWHIPICGIEGNERALPIDPYVLGVWQADGDVNARLATVDQEILREVERCHKVKSRVNDFIPEEYFGASVQQRLDLLAGFMDGDGTISHQGQAWFVNKSYRLARDYYRLISSLGQKAVFSEFYAKLNGQRHGPYYKVLWTPTVPVFKLPRKLSRQTYSPSPSLRRRFIKSIEPIGQHDTQCFSVEREDGLVLWADSYILSVRSKWLAAEILPVLFKDDAHVWIVANDYKLAEPEFGYCLDWLRWLGAPLDEKDGGQVSTPLNGRQLLRLPWGARLETQSAEDLRKIEAGNLDIAAIAEAGQTDPRVMERLGGRVLEKNGDILMSGSFEDTELWYMEAFQVHQKAGNEDNWQSFSIPSWDNVVIFPGGRDDPKIKELEARYPDNVFKLKICAEVAKPSELVFPEFDVGIHVVPLIPTSVSPEGVPVDQPIGYRDQVGRIQKYLLPLRSPTEVAIDPGYNGAYAVEFIQKHNGDIFIVDEVYLRQTSAQDVIRECKDSRYWADVVSGVIDVAGTQHQGMASHKEIWAEPENGNVYLRHQKVPVADGITRLRTFLRDPGSHRSRIFIDPKCKNLIREFQMYRYRSQKDNRPEREEPIDRDNHAIKAIIYWLVDRFGFTNSTGRRVSTESYIAKPRMPWATNQDHDFPFSDPYQQF